MKLILALTFIFFTVASCNFSSFLLKHAPLTNLKDHRKIDDLRYFFLTLYDQFNLTEPTQLVNCFNDKTAGIFFKALYEVPQLLNDTKERNQVRLHLDYAKLALLERGLKDSRECVLRTKDFSDLLEALDVDIRDPEQLRSIKHIYYQARYSALLNDFVPLIKGLEAKNNRKAGTTLARVISNMVETVKYRGLFYLMAQGFANGFAQRLGVSNPSDSIRCWDNESAGIYLEFFLKLSETISTGKWKESPINTHFFWRDHGKDIMKRIPEEVFQCVEKSSDAKEVIDKLGVDIYDEKFLDMMIEWINDNRMEYFMMMKGMKNNFDKFDFSHAGYIYGHFMQRVAKLNPDESDKGEFSDM